MMTIDQLEYGIVRFGTPLYVFDLDEADRVISDVRKTTEESAKLCFAMKANPFLVNRIAYLADRIEVCSRGEYEICRTLGVDPGKLLISGVLKERKDLERILADCRGACVYTVESMNQLILLAQWAQKHQERLHAYLRLTSGNQFGMDKKTVKELFSIRKSFPLITIDGLHFFSGTQKRSSDAFKQELTWLDQFIRELETEENFKLKALEYGPGIAIPYFKGQEDHRKEDLENLCKAVRGLTWKGQVFLEMGRYLTGSAGYYLTSIKDLKTSDGKNYCIVDGGIHQFHYDGQIKGIYQPFVQISPQREEGEEKEWTICGSLCTDNDVLVKKIRLQGIKPGDILVFHRAGAYAMTEGLSLFLSHSLPGIAFYSRQGGWKLARAQQPTYLWNMEKEVKDGYTDSNFERH